MTINEMIRRTEAVERDSLYLMAACRVSVQSVSEIAARGLTTTMRLKLFFQGNLASWQSANA
jgi:hypothetical protein